MSASQFLSILGATVVSLIAGAGCGPSSINCSDPAVLANDTQNCGACGVACKSDQACTAGQCLDRPCNPGEQSACYTGTDETKNVGSCRDGNKICQSDGTWGQCDGQVIPVAEVCGNGADDNCSGAADEDTDLDGDGFTTCGGDCCDSVECSDPALVNPGSFDAAGNNLDDDCDGAVDNTLAACDTGLQSDTLQALDYAKAIDICQVATASDRKWGVIDAKFTLVDGSNVPSDVQHAIRGKFGSGVLPKAGASLAMLSTGHAAGKNDTRPSYKIFDQADTVGRSSSFPADFFAANAGKLPNAPGCPGPDGNRANDAIMLTLSVRAPTNAKSFSLATNFFSSEYPEYTCTPYNDFFTVLLDSTYAGSPENPTDKNLAFYQDAAGLKYPIGVNLAYSANGTGTGLFNQCVNGSTGCADDIRGSISTCTGVDQLLGTGFDEPRNGECDGDSLMGGGTGWLVTKGNVVGGEVFKLRIAIWDTSDAKLDSLAIIDNFTWSVDLSDPGTVIE